MTPTETLELSDYLKRYLAGKGGASCSLPEGQLFSVNREWVESLANQTWKASLAWAREMALEVVRQYGAQRLTEAAAPPQAPVQLQIQLVVPPEAIKVEVPDHTKVVTFDRDARGNIVKARSSVEEESEVRRFLNSSAAP